MNPSIYNRTTPPSGPQRRRPNRPFVIDANSIPTNEEAIPLKVLYGTRPITGHFIYPVWNFRKTPVESDAAKGDSVVVGYRYRGSLAQALCVGPVTKLHKISIEDKVLWEGPLDVSAADGDGKSTITISNFGVINFYWGTDTQQPDSILQALQLDTGSGLEFVKVPGLPRVCYFVANNAQWGRQPVPPILTFELSRYSSALALSAHQVEGDAIIPEVIYEWLTDKFFGAGLDTSLINSASFVSACETLITEGVAASPLIDDFESVRDVLAKFHTYVDGFPFLKEGQIHFRLTRPGDEVAVPIDESDLAEEPQPVISGWEETWNFTRISFQDRNKDWESGAGTYDDSANAIIVGENRSKQFDLPWITRQIVADTVAARLGRRGGLPAATWSLGLLPSHRTLRPGQVLEVSYDKFGLSSVPMRVVEVNRGTPENPLVNVEAIEEHPRHTTGDDAPGEDSPAVPEVVDETGDDPDELVDTTPRLAFLPNDLKDGYLDGLLIACHRPTGTTTAFTAWLNWARSIDGGYIDLEDVVATPETSTDYRELQTFNRFPIKAELLFWQEFEDGWLLRVRVPEEWDDEEFAALADVDDVYCCTGILQRAHDDGDSTIPTLVAMWGARVIAGRWTAVAANIYDVKVTAGAFSTAEWSLETSAADGVYPTEHIYFGRLTAFGIYQTDTYYFDRAGWNSPHYLDPVRLIKAPVTALSEAQTINDVDPSAIHDSTGGSGVKRRLPSWGTRALTGYEFFDVSAGGQAEGVDNGQYSRIEDLDEALQAIYDGTETSEQTELAGKLDAVLGGMIDTRSPIYNLAGL